MTQNETYAAMAVIAFLAYSLGLKKATVQAAAAESYDPLGWLNSYTTA